MHRFFHQKVLIKFTGRFHHGINRFEKFHIAAVEVFLPQMLSKPGAAHRPHTPGCSVHDTRNTPDISIVMHHPTAGTVHIFCCFLTGHGQFFHHFHQRFVHFFKVAFLSRPVVHFRVDVDGVLAVPGRVSTAVPDSLKVCGLSAGL